MFRVRVSWHGHKHVFHVHPIVGPSLIDPQEPNRKEKPEGPTKNVLVNAVFKRPEQPGAVDGNMDIQGAFGGVLPRLDQIMPENLQDLLIDHTFTVHLDMRGIERLVSGIGKKLFGLFRSIGADNDRAIEDKDRR